MSEDIDEDVYDGKLIESISIENFRGIKGEQTLNLTTAKNITFLTGINNSGKSIIAKAFGLLGCNTDSHDVAKSISISDFYDMDDTKMIEISFLIGDRIYQELQQPLIDINITNFYLSVYKKESSYNLFKHYKADGKNSHIYNTIYKNYESDFTLQETKIADNLKGIDNYLKDKILVFEPVKSILLNPTNKVFTTGKGMIDWLYDTKNRSEAKMAKNKVNKWLKEEFNLEAPLSVNIVSKNINNTIEKDIEFTFEDNFQLYSSELGTGYMMLYILLMEIAMSKKLLYIIDEIETHLQPGLVRKLIELLRKETEAQIIISTHSPTVIQCIKEGDYLYHFKKIIKTSPEGIIEKECKFEAIINEGNKSTLKDIAIDLGVIPGDAFLANSIIWVEGPSEVKWVRAWLRAYQEYQREKGELKINLIEGLHYAIIMTGGNLISHYSFEESETPVQDLYVDDFIKLLKINPAPIVIMDSDNANSNSQKYKRAERFEEEIRKHNGQAEGDVLYNFWKLEARELENYTPSDLLKSFYDPELSDRNTGGWKGVTNWDVYDVHKGVGTILTDQGMSGITGKSKTTIKHKKELSQYIFNNLNKEFFSDENTTEVAKEVRDKIKNIVTYIEKANGL